MALARFKYTAIDQDGARTRGSLHAEDSASAYTALAEMGLTPLGVKPAGGLFTHQRRRVTREHIADLTRELSVLVAARIPVARGLRAVGEHERNDALREIVLDIAAGVEAGEKLTDGLSRHRGTFGDVYIETMRAAEQSASLDEVTPHLADMLDREIEGRRQLGRAMAYPTIVLGFVLVALLVITVFVVPRFAAIFEANEVDLPLATRVVQTVGESLRHYWYVYAGLIAAGAAGVATAWHHPVGRRSIELWMLRLPYVGRLLVASTTARFSRVLAVSLAAGLNLVESVEIAGRATGRPAFVDETADIAARVRGGATLVDAAQSSRYLPAFARRMLSAGSDAKELSAASRILASHFDRQSDHLAKNVNTIIEPIITVGMAMIVLLVALAVFVPMWQMVKVH